jgi:hypothetical protein
LLLRVLKINKWKIWCINLLNYSTWINFFFLIFCTILLGLKRVAWPPPPSSLGEPEFAEEQVAEPVPQQQQQQQQQQQYQSPIQQQQPQYYYQAPIQEQPSQQVER